MDGKVLGASWSDVKGEGILTEWVEQILCPNRPLQAQGGLQAKADD